MSNTVLDFKSSKHISIIILGITEGKHEAKKFYAGLLFSQQRSGESA